MRSPNYLLEKNVAGVPEIVEHGLDIAGVVNVLAEAGLPLDPHAQVSRDLGQPVHEILQVLSAVECDIGGVKGSKSVLIFFIMTK